MNEGSRTSDVMFCSEQDYLEMYTEVLDEIKRDGAEFLWNTPENIRHKYLPILTSLLDLDPKRRKSITDLSQDPQFMPGT